VGFKIFHAVGAKVKTHTLLFCLLH